MITAPRGSLLPTAPPPRKVNILLVAFAIGLLEREMLPVVDGYYTERKFNNMALLLNGATAAYGRYGYRRYGYHYGYGNYVTN